MSDEHRKLLRIGVFYDGGFFYHVNNYYRYSHTRRTRLSISGLHNFVRHYAANKEGVDPNIAQIVDSHMFRGRFSAQQSQSHTAKLLAERTFDDVLMNEGVTTHYLPMLGKKEKGIDVWLSLEAFELTIYKKYDIVTLIAGDSDFVPLVRKINSLGSRVMILGWNFEDTDHYGHPRETVTSARLLKEATYPIMMHEVIDKAKRSDPVLAGLFVDAHTSQGNNIPPAEAEEQPPAMPQQPDAAGAGAATGTDGAAATADAGDSDGDDAKIGPQHQIYSRRLMNGTILTIKEGFGFIQCPEYPDNVFFHYSSLINRDFSELKIGDKVAFYVQQGQRGYVAQDVDITESAVAA